MMLTSHTKCAWPSMEGTDPPSDEVVRPPIHETSNSHPVSFKSRGATPAWISSMSNPLAAATMRTAASGLTAASSAQVAQSPAPVHRGEARRAVVEDEEIVKPTPTTRATTMREDRPGIPRCARAHRTEKPLAATKRTRAAMRGSYPKRSGNQRRTRMYPRKASQIALLAGRPPPSRDVAALLSSFGRHVGGAGHHPSPSQSEPPLLALLPAGCRV